MKQKLRATRNGMMILFAILCIVCLSLSLALSARFAAYAEESVDEPVLANEDDRDHYLWVVSYTDRDGSTHTENLWNGTHEGNVIQFLDGMGNVTTNASALNCYTPYRGTEITLTINPEYLVNGMPILDIYSVTYKDNVSAGEMKASSNMLTTATLTNKTDAADIKVVNKEWAIVSLVNALDIGDNYIDSTITYGQGCKCVDLTPMFENTIISMDDAGNINSEEKYLTVIYDFSIDDSHNNVFALRSASDGSTSVMAASYTEEFGYQVDSNTLVYDVNTVSNEGGYLNYVIRRLPVGEYTLYVASVAVEQDGICYVPHVVECPFEVEAQDLEYNFSAFTYDILNRQPVYTDSDAWISGENGKPGIGFTLKLGNIVLIQDVDYTITASDNEVGLVDLIITGNGGNIVGEHKLTNAVTIRPATNDWQNDNQPGMMSWIYGTYSPDKFLITGKPIYLSDVDDILFKIVKLVERTVDGEQVLIEVAPYDDDATLNGFHYFVKDAGTENEQWIVNDEVAAKIAGLGMGKYRLIVSVAANNNYYALEERRVDFSVLKGSNGWKIGAEPQILGWTAGKLASTDGLINAEAIFGTPILMIYDMDDTLIYSNLPTHADSAVGDIEVLKNLKAGRYYLSAEVKGTVDYDGIKATVLFDVTPNRLPTWAVILIVVGSLAIVAAVFTVLHQKGILQMLTGKVILAMRTRANVDATLAAIRAAKVAREAEASVAAAKARDAEEAAKKNAKDKK